MVLSKTIKSLSASVSALVFNGVIGEIIYSVESGKHELNPIILSSVAWNACAICFTWHSCFKVPIVICIGFGAFLVLWLLIYFFNVHHSGASSISGRAGHLSRVCAQDGNCFCSLLCL